MGNAEGGDGGWWPSEHGSEITSCDPPQFVACTPAAALHWLFAELGTVCHYLQSLELFAKLVAAGTTI